MKETDIRIYIVLSADLFEEDWEKKRIYSLGLKLILFTLVVSCPEMLTDKI